MAKNRFCEVTKILSKTFDHQITLHLGVQVTSCTKFEENSLQTFLTCHVHEGLGARTTCQQISHYDCHKRKSTFVCVNGCKALCYNVCLVPCAEFTVTATDRDQRSLYLCTTTPLSLSHDSCSVLADLLQRKGERTCFVCGYNCSLVNNKACLSSLQIQDDI